MCVIVPRGTLSTHTGSASPAMNRRRQDSPFKTLVDINIIKNQVYFDPLQYTVLSSRSQPHTPPITSTGTLSHVLTLHFPSHVSFVPRGHSRDEASVLLPHHSYRRPLI